MALKRVLPVIAATLGLMVACGNGDSPAEAPPGTDTGGRGAKLYAMHCVLCHGKEGDLGVSGAKDLTISSLSRQEMVAIVTNGKGAMAAYRNVLTKAEIDAVVEHVRSLRRTP
jgi:cytochrome c6